MSEMIARMAQAMRDLPPVQAYIMPPQDGDRGPWFVIVEDDEKARRLEVSDRDQARDLVRWITLIASAHAALEVMRKPTEAMIGAGWYSEGSTVEERWRAMIEAALK